ncbi:H/ACA ribonucleoprotein complex subunit 2 [Cladophialophora psammophila CBS 110553]|uniref:H/ACA ribonucleoprotein complex subunit 2 n=1 Tax=Cladophialophora psammophila CBS 110553 TaxID=1182543 RepID=W9W891_9EURO|nr:H/ACA ribonucleoprotein complex subunit 2 [Cladophialophora psammophila CBS 110553]EXJ61210.1 H/ACA ribonucleoprotein complex subunit 2 [Cladophialophora psammophila CBS 110553]
MAKDKSATAERKAERKAEKKALKAEKVAKKQAAATSKAGGAGPTGVTKAKGENKEKKAARKVLAEKALSELKGKGNEKIKSEAEDQDEQESGEEEDEEMEEQNGVKVEEADEEEEDSEKPTKKEGIVEEKKKILATRPVGALVPFANPLADDKVAKKVFKCVKKAASQRTLRRGVKEVVKALRKSPTSSSTENLPLGVVVLAADISPMDVISHIPVLSEDHNVPYIYVTSRAELGTAGLTKRPTSVVMVSRDAGKKAGREGKEKETKADGEGDEKESWEETYKGLVKAVEREGRHVKI